MKEIEKQRLRELTHEFYKINMLVPRQSPIVKQYIFLGEKAVCPDVEELVSQIAKTHFLIMHCDHQKGLELSRKECMNVRLPRVQWDIRVSCCVLKANGLNNFPYPWPWESIREPVLPVLMAPSVMGTTSYQRRRHVMYENPKKIQGSRERSRSLSWRAQGSSVSPK